MILCYANVLCLDRDPLELATSARDEGIYQLDEKYADLRRAHAGAPVGDEVEQPAGRRDVADAVVVAVKEHACVIGVIGVDGDQVAGVAAEQGAVLAEDRQEAAPEGRQPADRRHQDLAPLVTEVSKWEFGQGVEYQELTTPADPDELLRAFARTEPVIDEPPSPPAKPLDELEWEHLQQVLTDCRGNISEAARRLGMHRRSLQRKLARGRPHHDPGASEH